MCSHNSHTCGNHFFWVPSWHVNTHWLLYLVSLAVLLLFQALYMRGRMVVFHEKEDSVLFLQFFSRTSVACLCKVRRLKFCCRTTLRTNEYVFKLMPFSWMHHVCFIGNWTVLVPIHEWFVNCSINVSTFEAETLKEEHLDIRNAILIMFTHFGRAVAKWWDHVRFHQYKHNKSEINSVQFLKKWHK